MLQNSHVFRGILYIIAVITQPLAYFLAVADPTGLWAEAAEKTAQFLAAMAGITAFGNLTPRGTLQSTNDTTTSHTHQ